MIIISSENKAEELTRVRLDREEVQLRPVLLLLLLMPVASCRWSCLARADRLCPAGLFGCCRHDTQVIV